MSKRLSLEELKSYLWNSAVLLRTNIDAGAYKQYIFPLLFFKRICDVYDEETEKAFEEYGEDAADFDETELHTFVVPKRCVSVREPYSAERRKAASERAKAAGYAPPKPKAKKGE